MPRNKSSKPSWQSSAGKKLLINDLRSSAIPMRGGDVAAIYNLRTEFGGNDPDEFRKFPLRLRAARKHVEEGMERAASEAKALDHDRQIYKESEFNQRNEPRWQGSQAEQLLKADISSGKHNGMKPSILYKTQQEYQKFPLHIFRGHIYQEEKLIKFLSQYGSRNNK
jgi:hypothetical protein